MDEFFNNSTLGTKWSILKLCLPSNKEQNCQVNDVADGQINLFRTTPRNCGSDIPSPDRRVTATLSLNEDENDQTIQDELEKISKTTAQIVLVILPNDNKHTYSRIKLWADVKFGKRAKCSDGLRLAVLTEVIQEFIQYVWLQRISAIKTGD